MKSLLGSLLGLLCGLLVSTAILHAFRVPDLPLPRGVQTIIYPCLVSTNLKVR
jgi:hypothetical protein